MKLSKKLTEAAGYDRDFKKELKVNKEKWEEMIVKKDGEITKMDKKYETKFFEAYKQKEIADAIARETSIERGYTNNDG